jgi:predicted AlkP superfamily phosphohydrolase/phosphomutase
MQIPFEVRISRNGGASDLVIDKQHYPLKKGEFTPYIQLNFRPGLGVKVRGLAQFYLIETEPHFKLYMSPINIDPEKPALPISHPFSYSVYLAKTQGPYSTLGLAEDTSALNEQVLDEDAFLKQAYQIHEEREKMFFDAMEKTSRGLVTCVFDITDRLQHMFFRCLDLGHPANKEKETEKHTTVIRDLYKNMDEMVGRIMDRIDERSILMVMSDHGFKLFKRCVNLNTFLLKHGFLSLKPDAAPDADYLQAVDWTKTQAYSIGFGGIYLNLKGREARGIVEPGEEAKAVKEQIAEKLKELYDPRDEQFPIRDVYDTREIYSGPYVREAPDLIAGFKIPYRASWSGVTGGVSKEIFEDNERGWSGDHNFNPPDVPGMLFCDRKIATDSPSIMDLGPTTLDLFGVEVPKYCDGRSILPE